MTTINSTRRHELKFPCLLWPLTADSYGTAQCQLPLEEQGTAEAETSEAPLQLMASVQGPVVLLLWVACLCLADASFFFTRLPGPISLAQLHASWMAALLTELKASSFANSGIPLPLRQQLLPRPILALLFLDLLTDLKHLCLNYL